VYDAQRNGVEISPIGSKKSPSLRAQRRTACIDKENSGKATATAYFAAAGDYVLRVQANDSIGDGGGGFQCCWTNAHVRVSVKPAKTIPSPRE
jgi:hypothetical protein